jgi:hypothetical protein
VQSEARPETAPPRRRFPLTNGIGLVAGLVGLVALGASAWVYGETQREVIRLSTDIAQLRLSLELYGRQQGEPAAADVPGLAELEERLAVLEDNWANAPAVTPELPDLSATPALAAPANGGDCLPPGTRFMVSAGDRYPVCGTGAVVEIGGVDNGFISLADGTVIAQGGNIALPNSACMIGVVPSEGGAITGFAEIRVSC